MHEIVLPFGAFLFLTILFASAWVIAYHLGFFIPLRRAPVRVTVVQTAGAFFLFLLLQLMVIPFFLMLFKVQSPSAGMKGTIQIVAILVTALVIFSYAGWTDQAKRWFRLEKWFTKIAFGALTWFLAYPTILFITQALGYVLNVWLQYPLQEQLAVQQVVHVKQFPIQLTLMVILMMTFVPLIEEILFRGFLQETFSLYFKPWGAIIATSIIFAFFHFSSSQGMNNIIIITALFSLSLLLGYLKERQASLWSPVALHAVFNGISLVQILFIE